MRRLTVGAAITAALILAGGIASAATVANGDFENGTFSGWTVLNEGSGDWYNYTGTTSPRSGFSIPAPPQGNRAAITDQPGPGSHLLFQDITLEPRMKHALSFILYYDNRADFFHTPNTFRPFSIGPNQQYRVDLLKATAPPDSLASADVLAAIFRTEVGDPLSVAPTTMTFDLTPWAGSTVRLRFGEVDNQGNFQAGVDAVMITSTKTTPTTKDDCKNGGWRNFTDDTGRPFKNQGDCVSYVATNGRNKASG